MTDAELDKLFAKKRKHYYFMNNGFRVDVRDESSGWWWTASQRQELNEVNWHLNGFSVNYFQTPEAAARDAIKGIDRRVG